MILISIPKNSARRLFPPAATQRFIGRYIAKWVEPNSEARGAAAQTFGSRAFQAQRPLSVKGSAAEPGTFGDERESLGTCRA